MPSLPCFLISWVVLLRTRPKFLIELLLLSIFLNSSVHNTYTSIVFKPSSLLQWKINKKSDYIYKLSDTITWPYILAFMHSFLFSSFFLSAFRLFSRLSGRLVLVFSLKFNNCMNVIHFHLFFEIFHLIVCLLFLLSISIIYI